MMREKEVAVIGLGYVGLPLLASVSRAGWSTVGVDIDQDKLNRLTSGQSPIEDISNHDVVTLQKTGRVRFSSDPRSIENADVVVFCLPTPVLDYQPDLRVLTGALHAYAPFFRSGALIVSESSSYPGTLRKVIQPICEQYKGVKQFFYGHSPERVDPGNPNWNNSNTPRIISGIGSESLLRMRDFYGSFCQVLVEVDTPEIAEAAKMFENSFRQVNIALVTEFARYCHTVGIPATQVLDAASTKPFGFMKFDYGAGVGGHCIPVDPYYLVDHAKRHGSSLGILEISNKVVADQPNYVFDRAKLLLESKLENRRVLVVGLSYKPNTADRRESPGVALMSILKEAGWEVYWYDPLCSDDLDFPKASPEHTYSLAIITVMHEKFDYTEVISQCDAVLDCTHSLRTSQRIVHL